jgi:hypothetical protein
VPYSCYQSGREQKRKDAETERRNNSVGSKPERGIKERSIKERDIIHFIRNQKEANGNRQKGKRHIFF